MTAQSRANVLEVTVRSSTSQRRGSLPLHYLSNPLNKRDTAKDMDTNSWLHCGRSLCDATFPILFQVGDISSRGKTNAVADDEHRNGWLPMICSRVVWCASVFRHRRCVLKNRVELYLFIIFSCKVHKIPWNQRGKGPSIISTSAVNLQTSRWLNSFEVTHF